MRHPSKLEFLKLILKAQGCVSSPIRSIRHQRWFARSPPPIPLLLSAHLLCWMDGEEMFLDIFFVVVAARADSLGGGGTLFVWCNFLN